MKHSLRILVLIYALLWGLAWSAAGRSDAGAAADMPDEPPAPAAEQPPGRGTPDADVTLRVLHGGTVETMAMDEYLRGVLRAEMPASFELEALKAQAIAARTYTLYKMKDGPIENHPDADACDDVNCCKAYRTAEDAAADWGGMALYYEEKLARAVAETDGQVVLYDGEPILAVFFSSSNGHTQNAGAVWQSDLPYLRSVSSPETGELVPNYYSVARVPAEEFRALFLAAHPEADLSGAPEDWIGDVARSDAGFVTSVTVGGATVKGNELRAILSLRSPSFTVEMRDGAFVFHVTGYGHGVGMSQYGANALAMQGLSAGEILEHYFTGASVSSARADASSHSSTTS